MELNGRKSLGSYIGCFYREGQSFLLKEFKALGIGAGQYQFLIHLYLEDGVSHEKLTEKLSVDKATTTRAIVKLEEEGYVKKVLNNEDKRKYHIYLTEKALSKKDEVLRISKLWEESLTGSLTEEELENLFYILNKIEKNNPNSKSE
ncbi:MAG: MarR family winged helix-turn-helix transcriptional regulator [Clostridium sp.]